MSETIFGPRALPSLLAPLLAALLAGAALAQEGTAAVPPAPDGPLPDATVTVVGRGVAYGEPDVAQLQVGASATDADVRAAVSAIDEAVSSITAVLVELGIPQEDIRTVSYNVWREERFPQPPQPLEGEAADPVAEYRAQHMLQVRVEGTRRAGELLAAVVDAGANMVGGITFELSDSRDLEAQARQLAVEDAMRRAQELAQAAGVELAGPVSIQEVSPAAPAAGLERAAAMMSFDAAPIAPGQLSVEVAVLIDFRVAP